MSFLLPKNVAKSYIKAGPLVFIYTLIKWGLTPFIKMEEYIPKKGKIFDLGCGNGLFSNYLISISREREITGVDYSSERIAVAKAAIDGRLNIVFLRGDVTETELSPCDCIIFSDFLHHLDYKSQDDLIRHSIEKLKTNGILVIKEIDKYPKWKFLISFLLDSFLNIRKKLYHRSHDEFKLLLEKFGLSTDVIPTHRFLPLSNIIYIARKK